MSSDLEKYRSLYFAEAQEQLTAINQNLDALTVRPGDREELNAAFRSAHTLKAMSATMGYGELTRAAHSLEDLIVQARSQSESLTDLNLRLMRNAADEINTRLQSAETQAVLSAVESHPGEAGAPFPHSPLTANVRVRQRDLNLLLEHVAELVASSSQLERAALEASLPQAAAIVSHQREQVRELRRLTWQLNMASVGPVFDRYTRILTELARQQDKKVRVVTQGSEVELCHAMLEALNEPLLHLLRNAITHGIEPSAERLSGGKEAAGTITLRAERAGDRVRIQISDDGRGMDAGAILQAAYAQGLVTREQRALIKPNEALRLVLLPNFSTAHTVTANAGRGIGMNVVQKQLDGVGGQIEISTEPGRRTVLTLDVPRLIGLLEVELVRTGTRVYAIPTTHIISARVWLASDVAKQVQAGGGSLHEWRILNADSLKPVVWSQLTAPAGVSLVELHDPPRVALRVDELLGRALLNYPFAVRPASVPILDPAAVLATRTS